MKVWVRSLTWMNHSELVVRLDDMPDDFWHDIEVVLPGWARFVSFGFYDLEYVEGRRSQFEALFSSPGAIEISFHVDSPEVWSFPHWLHPVALSAEEHAMVLRYVRGDMLTSTTGKVQRLADSEFDAEIVNEISPEKSVAVGASKPYNAFNICHTWVLDSLRAAGLKDIPQRPYRASEVLERLERRFPREQQSCAGYLNHSARPPGEPVNRIIRRKLAQRP